MSGRNHPPDVAKPQTWREWGFDTAVATGDYETKITPLTPAWQRGLGPELIAQIARHRCSRPSAPLPAEVQRRVGRNWIEHARGTR